MCQYVQTAQNRFDKNYDLCILYYDVKKVADY